MTREELLKTPEYWQTMIQLDMFAHINAYMEAHNMNRTELAHHLGVSKGYVTQILNGDYDHRVSKLVEISLKLGYAPKILYQPMEEVLIDKGMQYHYDTNSEVRFSRIDFSDNNLLFKSADNNTSIHEALFIDNLNSAA